MGLNDLNTHVVDLMEVFSTQGYIHPGFKGSSSIKASDTWNKIVTGDDSPTGIATQRRLLLTYCGAGYTGDVGDLAGVAAHHRGCIERVMVNGQ